MKTQNQIMEIVNQKKELLKAIEKVSHYRIESFCADIVRYVNAVKEERMMCIIDKVSASGMSRTMKFIEMDASKCKVTKQLRGRLYNFYAFFKSLGHTMVKDSDYFRVGGCGMDMVFHVNYSIIHRLERLGVIEKAECEKLAQMTPHKV